MDAVDALPVAFRSRTPIVENPVPIWCPAPSASDRAHRASHSHPDRSAQTVGPAGNSLEDGRVYFLRTGPARRDIAFERVFRFLDPRATAVITELTETPFKLPVTTFEASHMLPRRNRPHCVRSDLRATLRCS